MGDRLSQPTEIQDMEPKLMGFFFSKPSLMRDKTLVTGYTPAPEPLILVLHWVLFCLFRVLSGQMPVEVSSPQVGASHQRLHGEQNPLFWDQFTKDSLQCTCARQVTGHTSSPEPLILVLYWVLFCLCRVLCGQMPVEVSSPQVGASHQRLHGEQNPLFWDQFTKDSLQCTLWARQVTGHTSTPEPLILVLYWVLFCLCRVLCGQMPVEVSSPQVGASHQRLHGEQNPLFWDQFTKHSLQCTLWARQVTGHMSTPEPLILVLHWVLFCLCRVLCGQMPVEVSSPQVGASHQRLHGEQNLLFWDQFTKHSLQCTLWARQVTGKTSYRPYANPRTIIYWYCTECCSVFVGFYVGKCLLKCPALKWE